MWYTSVSLYYTKVLCGEECGIHQSSCIILKNCVGRSVVYVSLDIYYIKVLCEEGCGIRQSSCIILRYCVGIVVYASLVVLY